GALHTAVSRRLGRALSRPQMSRIYQVSAGNPFYAIELARTLLDQPSGAQVSMPATLMELVHNRIGTLDPTVREALLAIACGCTQRTHPPHRGRLPRARKTPGPRRDRRQSGQIPPPPAGGGLHRRPPPATAPRHAPTPGPTRHRTRTTRPPSRSLRPRRRTAN